MLIAFNKHYKMKEVSYIIGIHSEMLAKTLPALRFPNTSWLSESSALHSILPTSNALAEEGARSFIEQ